MTLFKPGEPPALKQGKPADLDKSTESAVEDDIREFVRRDVATARKSPDGDGEAVANNISTLLQRVAGCSVAEIDLLISELSSLRELLQSEGARIQGAIIKYAHLSQSAMQSTKIISEQLANWRNQSAQARSAAPCRDGTMGQQIQHQAGNAG